jgi:mono/diheme cytochrome c family protein
MGIRQQVLVSGLALAAVVVLSSNAWQRKPAPAGQPTREELEHGRYLVEEVAKCAECHTPRKANGELDEQSWLQGAPIWIRPVANIQPWADHAPALAGLPSFTDEQMDRVLERGTGPNGEPLRAPMHIYHLTQADARAIVAYLKSLPTPMR